MFAFIDTLMQVSVFVTNILRIAQITFRSAFVALVLALSNRVHKHRLDNCIFDCLLNENVAY